MSPVHNIVFCHVINMLIHFHIMFCFCTDVKIKEAFISRLVYITHKMGKAEQRKRQKGYTEHDAGGAPGGGVGG